MSRSDTPVDDQELSDASTLCDPEENHSKAANSRQQGSETQSSADPETFDQSEDTKSPSFGQHYKQRSRVYYHQRGRGTRFTYRNSNRKPTTRYQPSSETRPTNTTKPFRIHYRNPNALEPEPIPVVSYEQGIYVDVATGRGRPQQQQQQRQERGYHRGNTRTTPREFRPRNYTWDEQSQYSQPTYSVQTYYNSSDTFPAYNTTATTYFNTNDAFSAYNTNPGYPQYGQNFAGQVLNVYQPAPQTILVVPPNVHTNNPIFPFGNFPQVKTFNYENEVAVATTEGQVVPPFHAHVHETYPNCSYVTGGNYPGQYANHLVDQFGFLSPIVNDDSELHSMRSMFQQLNL